MSQTTRFILKLTARIEIYTNLIVVPLAVYFAVISGGYSNQKIYYFLISTLIAAGVMMIIGTALRYFRLSKILNRLNDEEADFFDIKRKLLEDPRSEGLLMCFRWIFGVALCYILFNSIVDLTFLESFPFVLINLFTLPVNSVIAYFTTENTLSIFLADPKISRVYLPVGSYKFFSVLSRTLFIVIPVLLIPVITLGYFLYLGSIQMITFPNLPYHITFIFFLSIAAIYTAVYESNAGIRSGLDMTVNNLESMERGNRDVHPIPMLTKGEVGRISQYVNILANSLRKSEEMFEKAFRSSPVGIAIIDLGDGNFLNVNESFLKITGFNRKDLLEKSYIELGLFPSEDESRQLVDKLMSENNLRNYDIHVRRKTGDVRVCTISAEIIQLWFRPSMLATIEDITEKKLLEKEIMRISETERQKIGQDLHDDLGPHLIGIEVLSKLLLKKLDEVSFNDISIVEKMRGLINDAITKTGRLARGLCPVHLVDHGFQFSLEELCRNIEDIYGASCTLAFGDPVFPVDPSICNHLYNIIQEAVHNAVKHGDAENISIVLNRIDGHAIVKVEDDGMGIPDAGEFSGMGLRIMNYRANIIGASIDIRGRKDEGTVVNITFKDDIGFADKSAGEVHG